MILRLQMDSRTSQGIYKPPHWGFIKWGAPENGWFARKNCIKIDDLGVPLFQDTSMDSPYNWEAYFFCVMFLWVSLLTYRNSAMTLFPAASLWKYFIKLTDIPCKYLRMETSPTAQKSPSEPILSQGVCTDYSFRGGTPKFNKWKLKNGVQMASVGSMSMLLVLVISP